MRSHTLRSDLLLLITAIIWGFAFVAQRKGMDFVGPYLFNAVRFTLGATSLLPLYFYFKKRKTRQSKSKADTGISGRALITGSIMAGVAIFIAASLQQIGVVYTTAGNAGFITGLYVIFVPIIGLFLKQKTGVYTWIGAILALIGMYYLSITAGFHINRGDVYVFISAIFWAAHVHIVARLSPKMSAILLSIIQFYVCAFFSFLFALFLEEILIAQLLAAALPILYAGLMSVGVAYTLQVVAQKDAPPAHAAILLSMESLFAVIGGWLILSEGMTARGIFGCLLMFAGMLISQLYLLFPKKQTVKSG